MSISTQEARLINGQRQGDGASQDDAVLDYTSSN